MAAPGTVTHVLEVARQLSAVVAAHAESLQQSASAAAVRTTAAAEAPPAA